MFTRALDEIRGSCGHERCRGEKVGFTEVAEGLYRCENARDASGKLNLEEENGMVLSRQLAVCGLQAHAKVPKLV